MKIQDPLSFWVRTALHLVCIFVLILLAIEIVSTKRIPIADVGAPVGLVILFFLIPVTGLGLWFHRRKRRLDINENSAYSKASIIFLTLTWLLSCLPIAFYGAVLIHHMPQPWQTSQQGPDTASSIGAFNTYFNFGPAFQGKNIYHVASPDLTLFRFEYTDPEALEVIMSELKFQKMTDCRLNLAGPPEWWPVDKSNLTCYGLPSGKSWPLSMGVNHLEKKVFFLEFSP